MWIWQINTWQGKQFTWAYGPMHSWDLRRCGWLLWRGGEGIWYVTCFLLLCTLVPVHCFSFCLICHTVLWAVECSESETATFVDCWLDDEERYSYKEEEFTASNSNRHSRNNLNINLIARLALVIKLYTCSKGHVYLYLPLNLNAEPQTREFLLEWKPPALWRSLTRYYRQTTTDFVLSWTRTLRCCCCPFNQSLINKIEKYILHVWTMMNQV